MASDLISRKALLKTMVDYEEVLEQDLAEPSFASAYRMVRGQPAVDAVEVVHGHNVYDHNSAFECSVCGFSDWDTLTSDDGAYNYCPNCGAKMDGDLDETNQRK